MENQIESAENFDKTVNKIAEKLFKNKLTGKAFGIRLLTLLGSSYLITHLAGMLLTASIVNATSENQLMESLFSSNYLVSTIIGFFSIVVIIINVSLIIRRVSDIVPDTDVWPYAIAAVIIGLIPVISIVLFIALVFIPSSYLNKQKRIQLLGKFA